MVIQVKDILDKVITEKLGVPRVLEEYRVFGAWKKVDLATIKNQAFPDKFFGGTLYLIVKNSTWAQQLSLMKIDIISKINEILGHRLVTDVKVRTGRPAEEIKAPEKKANKICPKCNLKHSAESDLCVICLREHNRSQEIIMYRLVDRNPKISYAMAKSQAPAISDEGFRRIKRELKAWKLDQNNLERRKYGWKKSENSQSRKTAG